MPTTSPFYFDRRRASLKSELLSMAIPPISAHICNPGKRGNLAGWRRPLASCLRCSWLPSPQWRKRWSTCTRPAPTWSKASWPARNRDPLRGRGDVQLHGPLPCRGLGDRRPQRRLGSCLPGPRTVLTGVTARRTHDNHHPARCTWKPSHPFESFSRLWKMGSLER